MNVPLGTLPGPVDPPPRLLMGPGPITAHPRVLQAMGSALVGQYDPWMRATMAETSARPRMVTRLSRTKPAASPAKIQCGGARGARSSTIVGAWVRLHL